MSFKVPFRKTIFRLLTAIMMVLYFAPSIKLAYGVTFTADKTITTNETVQQKFLTNTGLTLTIEDGASVIRNGDAGVNVNSVSDSTIIIKSGGLIEVSGNGTRNNAIKANSATNTTITNSGTISAENNHAIKIDSSTNGIITNNAGGTITAGGNFAILANSSTNLTITNSGTISVSPSSSAIQLTDSTGATIILKDGGLIIGKITTTGTGNKLQFDHGFGRSYFYETSGDFTLEDLSGNTVLKGSAGSISLARQETVDEMLGLRAFNLRSALKRYASAPMSSDDNMVWGETFGYTQKRGGTDTLLKYDTHGYGMNFIYPVMSKLGLILSVERNKLDFAKEYEVSRTGFLAGINVPEFSGFGKGNWKLGGFAVAGMGWYDSSREILTNTTSTGLLDVGADYRSVEVITGLNIKNTHQSPSNGWIKNKWDTEMGLTLQGSRTPDYNEQHYFSFEERTLIQESVHLGEQLTSTFNDRLAITLGLEYEFRFVLAGKNQTYRINDATADYDDGSFSQNSGSGNLGLSYRFGSKSKLNQGLAYIQFNSRLSDETRGTYGGSLGISINF